MLLLCIIFVLFCPFKLLFLQKSDADVVDAGDAGMPSTPAAVTTRGAAVEHTEGFMDQEAQAVDVDAEEDPAVVVRTTGVLVVRCVPTAREDSVPRSHAPDATLAAAQVSLSPARLEPLSTIPLVNAARKRLHLDNASGHACGLAAAPALHPSLSSNL